MVSELKVQVRPAAPDERRLLEGLLQFYVYDFSELEPEGSNSEKS
jgi:hypothetical protein